MHTRRLDVNVSQIFKCSIILILLAISFHAHTYGKTFNWNVCPWKSNLRKHWTESHEQVLLLKDMNNFWPPQHKAFSNHFNPNKNLELDEENWTSCSKLWGSTLHFQSCHCTRRKKLPGTEQELWWGPEPQKGWVLMRDWSLYPSDTVFGVM